MNSKKLLIFHPALAPYRIDYFNDLNEIFDVKIIFLYKNLWNHSFDQKQLLEKLECDYSFLTKGPNYQGRVFRFGIFNEIRKYKPNIILSFEYSFTTIYLTFLKRSGLIKAKLGTTTDDSIEISKKVQSKLRKMTRSFLIPHIDFFCVLSEKVSDFYTTTFGIEKERVIVYPILQNNGRLRNDKKNRNEISQQYVEKYDLNGKRVILFVGRMIPEKGLVRFLENVYTSLENRNDIKLVLVGEGNETETIKAFIHSHDLKNQVLLPGRFESESLYAWYELSSGFILPSLFEPFGAVVNEALIFGLPVFCSTKAGASTLITGDNGILFDPLSSNETLNQFGDFIKKLPVFRLQLGQKSSLMEKDSSYYLKNWKKLNR